MIKYEVIKKEEVLVSLRQRKLENIETKNNRYRCFGSLIAMGYLREYEMNEAAKKRDDVLI